jgi:hypothetical protein
MSAITRIPRSILLAAALSAFVPACGGASSASNGATPASPATPASTARPAWIARSDDNARILLAVEVAFNPESASRLGEETADERTVDLAPGFRERRVAALADARTKLDARRAAETDPLVLQDLAILLREVDLQVRETQLDDRVMVRHWDVARMIFGGLSGLLDDQITPARRARAAERLRRYVGLSPGSTPLADLARADLTARLARPEELTAKAHEAFSVIQAEMQKVAGVVARERHLPSADYRDVIRALKADQIVGDAILPHYQRRLADIEAILRREHLVTLPSRPARIRLGTAAESAQQPAPHMDPPRLLGNTGEQGEFVLPLSIPAPTGSKEAEQKYDDFTYAAASWTLIAHEARPGHELQFDAMVERGVSLARARYAFNSTNVEGWGLYAEAITLPFMPPEGQLVSLQLRLQRAVRAFIDPELQLGKWTFDSARDFLEREVGLSPAFATAEVERYTFRMPGQATSYFYGYTRLRALRAEVEQKLGARFVAQDLHDAILGEGLMPPDLLRQAVLAKLGAK